ncbi:biotin/lipoyl-binding protein [Thermomonas sp. S9]|uniref:biotin/lipoyl-binding protein n=1 Tax=Thermomonas sp. S9 TaxID=2885203 RepID=UPI00216AFDD5|nr:biotin/lipoyl-binding protein [Thermomonas sp. S9]MCR6495241.1 biotin/lipoyl-binding protein [Thermomonas sp. S9]
MSPRLRRAAGIAGAAAILALLGWRLWPRSEATAAAAAPAAAPDGSVQLAPSQVQGLGIALAPVRRADRVPVTGLPAQTEAPLEASQQVASPWAGTVSALLVHEGEQVRAGQPVLRLRSPDACARAPSWRAPAARRRSPVARRGAMRSCWRKASSRRRAASRARPRRAPRRRNWRARAMPWAGSACVLQTAARSNCWRRSPARCCGAWCAPGTRCRHRRRRC